MKNPAEHKTPLAAWRSYRQSIAPELLAVCEPTIRTAFFSGIAWATRQVDDRAAEMYAKVLAATKGEEFQVIPPVASPVAEGGK